MKYVLFVCHHNAGRSQMAQAFFERYAPDDVRAESAGDEPARRIWPEVIEAMAEVGIDLSERRPRKLLPEMQLHADWAVTLACGAACPYVPTTVEDWDIEDPAGKPIEGVRGIRDDIESRVKQLIAERLDQIGPTTPPTSSACGSACRSRSSRARGAPRRSAPARMRFSPNSTRLRCADSSRRSSPAARATVSRPRPVMRW